MAIPAAAVVINAERGKAKLPPIKSGELFRRLEKLELEQTVKVNRPKFSDLIDELIKIKSGPNGGVGMTELEPATKREWNEKLSHLKSYIGIFNTGHEPEDLIRLITTEGINKAKRTRSPGKGKPWAPRTRFKTASKIKEFGAWLVKIKKRSGWNENHFEELPKLYQVKHKPKHKPLAPGKSKSCSRPRFRQNSFLTIFHFSHFHASLVSDHSRLEIQTIKAGDMIMLMHKVGILTRSSPEES
mgnify:FL=1